MFASRRLPPRRLIIVLFCLSNFYLCNVCLPNRYLSNLAFAQRSHLVSLGQVTAGQAAGEQVTSDQVVAERVLGGQWKQIARRAGIIFVGTILATDHPPAASDQSIPLTATIPAEPPTIQLSFHVERAMAGVDSGQVFTIHEWVGASSMHRTMSVGQHVLLFLNSPSRLGFTSPVGGAQGEVLLDSSGENVVDLKPATTFKALNAPEFSTPSTQTRSSPARTVTVDQLERAIRGVRQSRGD
jgi:hypothetical protein